MSPNKDYNQIEIIQGTENLIKKSLQGLSSVRERFDSCSDSLGPQVIVTTEPIWNKLIELKEREVKIRFLTEITKENITYCKEFIKIAEVRHFDEESILQYWMEKSIRVP